jgi:HPt (histidine-containing phosphotransfer) domain-containing protein
VAVDWQVLRDVFDVTSAEFVRELVANFHEDAGSTFPLLEGARREADLGAWRRIAHKFRGSCAGVGARGMMEVTSQMEALEAPDLDAPGAALMEELGLELRRVEAALRAERWREDPQPSA